MPDNKKQEWKQYAKKLRHYIVDLQNALDDTTDYIDDMDSEGNTNATPPPPVENPPPPPNP